jgi:hypothetical protein
MYFTMLILCLKRSFFYVAVIFYTEIFTAHSMSKVVRSKLAVNSAGHAHECATTLRNSAGPAHECAGNALGCTTTLINSAGRAHGCKVSLMNIAGHAHGCSASLTKTCGSRSWVYK